MEDVPAPGPPRTKITTTELESKTTITDDAVEREGDRADGAEEMLGVIFLDA
jgi:hypothetical protein